MADDDFLSDGSDEFEKLLNSFINTQIEDDDENEISEKKENESKEDDELLSAFKDISAQPKLSEEAKAQNDEASRLFEQELAETFSVAREAISEEETTPELGSEESELAQAFVNYKSSVNKLSLFNLQQTFDCDFELEDLYPNYKPSRGKVLANDLVKGWKILCRIFPQDIAKFPVSSTDEEFLNFAETLKNQDLQLAIISYVEILIDLESCEINYQAKLLQYQEKHIKRIMYEEYLARKERQRRFTEAVAARNFPIDAERLISNYFRVAQKDVDGAYKALTTNPAIFAPIDFSKIKPRFFGLVKVSPKDGIRINLEIGNFLKKLKV